MIKMVFLFTIVIFYLNMFGYLTFLFLLTCLLSYLLACLFINECLVKIIKIYWKLLFLFFPLSGSNSFWSFSSRLFDDTKKKFWKRKKIFLLIPTFFFDKTMLKMTVLTNYFAKTPSKVRGIFTFLKFCYFWIFKVFFFNSL